MPGDAWDPPTPRQARASAHPPLPSHERHARCNVSPCHTQFNDAPVPAASPGLAVSRARVPPALPSPPGPPGPWRAGAGGRGTPVFGKHYRTGGKAGLAGTSPHSCRGDRRSGGAVRTRGGGRGWRGLGRVREGAAQVTGASGCVHGRHTLPVSGDAVSGAGWLGPSPPGTLGSPPRLWGPCRGSGWGRLTPPGTSPRADEGSPLETAPRGGSGPSAPHQPPPPFWKQKLWCWRWGAPPGQGREGVEVALGPDGTPQIQRHPLAPWAVVAWPQGWTGTRRGRSPAPRDQPWAGPPGAGTHW